MSLFKNRFSFLALLPVLLLPAPSHAQLSEGQLTEFVPSQSFLGVSVNMEKLMEGVDQDHPVMKQFREREKASPVDLTESRHMMFLLTTSQEEDADEFSIPGVSITRYKDVIDQEKYLERMTSQAFGQLQFQKESYKDYDLHIGKFAEEDVVVMGETPSHFFSAEDIVITGGRGLLTEMIDAESDDTIGKELVGNLNLDCEFHLLLEDGSVMAGQPFVQMMFGELPLPGVNMQEMIESVERLEVVADTSQMTPVIATLEMSTEDAAEQVEQLISTGLQAAPGLLMMAESTLDEAVESESAEMEEEVESIARFLIKLGKSAVDEVQVNRDGSTIEVQLGSVEGLDQLGGQMMLMFAWQTLTVERMMEEFESLELDGIGEID